MRSILIIMALLITPTYANYEKEINCLTDIVYHEARGEGEVGKKAVVDVIRNRTEDYRFPNSFCGVRNHRINNRCQFVHVCNGSNPINTDDFNDIKQDVKEALKDDNDITHGALYFFNRRYSSSWLYKLRHTANIGNHKFFTNR